MNKKSLIFCICIFFAVHTAHAVTVTVPATVPDLPYTASFTNEATGYFEYNGVSLQFSPFVGFASGTLSGGLQVIEIEPPTLDVLPIDSGAAVAWPGIYGFPSGATGTWRYQMAVDRLQKDLILSEPAIDALPSATAAAFFPGCVSPWVVVGDIDFQLDLAGGQLYADGHPFGISDATYARAIEVKSPTGDLLFTLETPVLETQTGEIRSGFIYYDGAEGVILYCFEFGDWQDAVRFDPTISTASASYIFDAPIIENNASTNFGTNNADNIISTLNNVQRSWLSFDISSYLTSVGISVDNISNVSAALRLTETGNGSGTFTIIVRGGGETHDESTITWNNMTLGSAVYTSKVPGQNTGVDVFNLTTYMAELVNNIQAGNTTAWASGVILISSEEDASTDYTYYHSAEAASESNRPVLTLSFDENAQLYDAAVASATQVILHASDYMAAGISPNSYYFVGVSGVPVQAGSQSYTNFSLRGSQAVTVLNIPTNLQNRPFVVESVGNANLQSFPFNVAGSGASAVDLVDAIYADARTTTKPEILSIVKSVSDQVTNAHASTDAYVIATYNQAEGARSQIVAVTTVTLPALETEIVSQIKTVAAQAISAATATPFMARTAVLLTTVENTSDPTVTGDPLRPWGYPGDIIASENHYRDVNGATSAVVSVIYYDNNLGVGQTLVVTDYETLETWNAALAAPLTVGVSVAIKPWAN